MLDRTLTSKAATACSYRQKTSGRLQRWSHNVKRTAPIAQHGMTVPERQAEQGECCGRHQFDRIERFVATYQ